MASQTKVHQPSVDGILRRLDIARISQERLNVVNQYVFFRKLTLATRKISTWSRGKLHCIAGRELFLVPTNYPTVDYLNLEEFTFQYSSCPTDWAPTIPQFESIPFIFDFRPKDNLNPLVEESEDKALYLHFGDYRLKFLEDMTGMRDWCYSVMQQECERYHLRSLQKRWDAAKYMKLLQTYMDPDLRRRRKRAGFGFQIYLDILITCCKDSHFIVEAISRMCQIKLDMTRQEFTLRLLPDEYIFFRCHLQRANLKDSRFREPEPVYDVLCEALQFNEVELMKIGLELECWSGYSNPIWSMIACIRKMNPSYELCLEPTLWPRNKGEVLKDSFYSVEFYAAFSYITIWTASLLFHIRRDNFLTPIDGDRKLLERNIVESFQLLWRAFPIPYLPIEDMQCAADMEKMRTQFDRPFLGYVVDEPTVWTTVAELFEDDFPTEFKPRSLKHLSRYAVRRLFRSPEQIASLLIPETLKQYLLLEL